MARTKVLSEDMKVNKDLDMNGKKATNAQDGDLAKDLVTKDQLTEAIEEVVEDLQWKATQW